MTTKLQQTTQKGALHYTFVTMSCVCLRGLASGLAFASVDSFYASVAALLRVEWPLHRLLPRRLVLEI